ncbi:uncharacterized protein LOC117218986 [Megalopta genalis]|uniref:uncharacterized protein LOC117218986 n=1 Tax=Megalopta genalis TaxID=115081 RepID=UPI003FD42271
MSTKREQFVNDDFEREATKTSGKIGVRHLQLVFWFLGNMIGYCLRVSISLAIVAMVPESPIDAPNSEQYRWNSSQQSTILSAFFWGYTVMQIPSGYIARVWSGQKLLAVGMLLCGIFNILTPIAALFGDMIGVCICRALMGLSQSCLLPCTQTLLSKWAPPNERARFGAFAYAGGQFGTVLSFPISGALAASSLGWKSIFYVFGALAVLWSIMFFIFGFDSPSAHPRISEMEKQYIENSLKTSEDEEGSSNKAAIKIPWKAIFTSVPMWALIIVHCCQNWGYWTLITEMPTYMNKVLKYDMAQNGLMSALPYLMMWLLSFPISWLADYALQRGASRGTTRKVCNTIAHWGPAIALICLAAVPIADSGVVVAMLAIAVGLNAGALCGFQINHVDLSPNFAGPMMSITNCIASVIAIIAPIICGVIIEKHEDSRAHWSIVFYLSAVIYFLGNLIFIIFGQGEVQSWNDPASSESRNPSKKESVVALMDRSVFFACKLGTRPYRRNRAAPINFVINMTHSHSMKRVSVISISEKMKIPATKPEAWFGCRHVQISLLAFGFLCCYAVRVTTSVTLEAMTNASTANPDFEEFEWNNSTKDIILSSFFWGYVCTQLVGSIIARRWGAQKLFSLALFICGLVTLLVPAAAKYAGWESVCVTRVIAGFCQGTVLPCLHTLLSKWVPTEERGRMSTFVYAGGWIGNVICLLSSGLLSVSSAGWPSCFYVWGGITIVSGSLAFFICKESPAEHPNIPQDEKEYIETSLGVTETEEKLPTPWRAMFTSLPMWALMATQSAHNWGFWMLLTKIPSYMASVLGYDIKQNGMLTALPYLTAWILSFPVSYFSDLLIRKGVISVGTSRKICNSIGQWIPAIALIALGYVEKEHPEIAVALLILAVASNVFVYCGHNVNHMDLSPNFAGTLMGITNTVANVCSILAPLVASIVVTEPSDVSQWRNIFFLSAIIYFLGNLLFVLFGTSKIQKWNDPITESKGAALKSARQASVENGYTEKVKAIESMEVE